MVPCWLTDTVTGDLDRAMHYTMFWGMEALELRRLGGEGQRVPFVNEEKLRRRLQEHEVSVAAMVPGIFEGEASDKVAWMNEVAALDEALQFARRIGCPRVVVSAMGSVGLSEAEYHARAAEALRQAGVKAARYGVRLAVLNELEGGAPAGASLAKLLAEANHPAVRAAWSPATALEAGEDPEVGLDALDGMVELVRCRDTHPTEAGWEEVLPGDGKVGWAHQLRRLREMGFEGPVSLELRIPQPAKQGLKAATRMIEWM